MILLYVDDYVIRATTNKAIDAAYAMFDTLYSNKRIGEPRAFLGMQIHRDRLNRTIFLHQQAYVESLITLFTEGVIDAAKTLWPPKTVIPHGWKSHNTVITSTDWLQRTGRLNWLASLTRPDIAFTTSRLSEANAGAKDIHLQVFKHLLRYLKGTSMYGIKLGGKGYTRHDLHLRTYADASFADRLEDRASTGGHVVFLANGPVLWKSKKQTLVTLNTTEAEFINLTPAAISTMWVDNLLEDLGARQPTPLVMFTDS
jgi:hypothetical protein